MKKTCVERGVKRLGGKKKAEYTTEAIEEYRRKANVKRVRKHRAYKAQLKAGKCEIRPISGGKRGRKMGKKMRSDPI